MPTTKTALKRTDNVRFTYKGKLRTGTVLHTTPSKTVLFLHGEEPPAHRVATLEVRNSLNLERITRADISKEQLKLADALTEVKKGDLVKLVDEELGTYVGLLDAIKVNGYSVSGLDNAYVFPFCYQIEKTEPLVKSKTMPLDKWTAKYGKSSTQHHDGGYCQKHTVFYEGKKVIEITEDAWGGECSCKEFGQVGGKDATEAFLEDAKASFIIEELPEKIHFFASAPDCIAEWLTKRELITLKDHFSK